MIIRDDSQENDTHELIRFQHVVKFINLGMGDV